MCLYIYKGPVHIGSWCWLWSRPGGEHLCMDMSVKHTTGVSIVTVQHTNMESVKPYGICQTLWNLPNLMESAKPYGICQTLWNLPNLMESAKPYCISFVFISGASLLVFLNCTQ